MRDQVLSAASQITSVTGADPWPWFRFPYGDYSLDALRGLGYHVLTSNGGVHNYGAPWYGSAAGQLPAGVTAAGIAAAPATGGYWVLKSDGGVDGFRAPWYGSMRGQIPAGQAVTGITGE